MADTVTVLPVLPGDRRLEREFISLPHRIYAGCPQWVPRFRKGVRRMLRREHPYFDHADAQFLIAQRNGHTVARLLVVTNRRYNEHHERRDAHFYYFDAFDDAGAVDALFAAAREWAIDRGCDGIAGPMLSGGAAGHGVLVDGFEHRAAMTMMSYNYPYYRDHLERQGMAKRVDMLSSRLHPPTFELPAKVRSVADKVLARGRFSVLRFSSKAELKAVAAEVVPMFNRSLAGHLQNYPLTQAELDALASDLLDVADPELIKILTYDGEYVGFLLAFPDVSEALRRSGGRLTPWAVLDIMREFKRTKDLVINGAGILPEYQRLGGNALLYYELERTAKSRDFVHADVTQVAESTELMQSDLERLGSEVYKRHRIYEMSL
jgi:ribosomal protein S18 acetylase RimI-like enzyme